MGQTARAAVVAASPGPGRLRPLSAAGRAAGLAPCPAAQPGQPGGRVVARVAFLAAAAGPATAQHRRGTWVGAVGEQSPDEHDRDEQRCCQDQGDDQHVEQHQCERENVGAHRHILPGTGLPARSGPLIAGPKGSGTVITGPEHVRRPPGASADAPRELLNDDWSAAEGGVAPAELREDRKGVVAVLHRLGGVPPDRVLPRGAGPADRDPGACFAHAVGTPARRSGVQQDTIQPTAGRSGTLQRIAAAKLVCAGTTTDS